MCCETAADYCFVISKYPSRGLNILVPIIDGAHFVNDGQTSTNYQQDRCVPPFLSITRARGSSVPPYLVFFGGVPSEIRRQLWSASPSWEESRETIFRCRSLGISRYSSMIHVSKQKQKFRFEEGKKKGRKEGRREGISVGDSLFSTVCATRFELRQKCFYVEYKVSYG